MKKLFLSLALLCFSSMVLVHAVTYTPAGIPASVFTNEWTPNTPANDMTLSNGLYVFAKRADFASNTNIQFKVCKDHGWDTAYPGSNYNFTIPAGAKYLVITYNTSGNAVSAFAISSITVAGDNGNLFGTTWAPTNTANDMTLQSDGTYKFMKEHVELSAGTINFKACANHSWDNAWPSSNYELSIPESGEYTITIIFNPATLSVTATAELEEAVVVIPTIQLHSNITNPSWESSANFVVAGNEETASLTLSGVSKGNYEFGVFIDGSWTSNGSAFTRANPSHAVTSGSGNCTLAADRNGDYTFTWTYATNTLSVTYPAIPAQSVELTGLSAEILKGTTVNFAATSSGIDNPGYRFYVKEKGGSYGSAVASYTFNAVGEYVVKVEALEDNTGDPVADDESEVLVYATHTFTSGSTIYIDFSDVSGDKKGVNFPKVDDASMDYDAAGAGTVKAVTFTANVAWNTKNTFIKTEKADWAGLMFIVPEGTENMVKVAADGASYSWDTYVPEPDLTTEFYLAGSFNIWSTTADRFMKATEDATEASVTITVSEYSNITFKVVDNGNWRGCDPTKTITKDDRSVTILSDGEGSNVRMTPYAAGDYIFTLNLNSRELTVTYPSGDPMPIPNNIYLSCDKLNDWASADPDYKFTVDVPNDIATLEVDLAATTDYAFKLVYNDAWMGANYDFKYYWCSDVKLFVDATQANLYSFKAGTYTFRYKLSTSELTIVYPTTDATPVSISSVGYATLYSATALDVPNDVQAYVVTGYEGIKLTMERIYRIPAQTGVLLQAEAGTYDFYEGDARYIDPVSANLLKGSTADEEINNSYVHYVLSYDESYRVGFFWPYGTGTNQGVGAFTNNAGKAYLELSGDQPAGVVARRGFAFTDQTDISTSVESTNSDVDSRWEKVLQGGTLLLKRGNQIFNAQGVRVQ